METLQEEEEEEVKMTVQEEEEGKKETTQEEEEVKKETMQEEEEEVKKTTKEEKCFLIRFYGISTLLSYLIPNKLEFICLHTVKWFQVLLSNPNNSI